MTGNLGPKCPRCGELVVGLHVCNVDPLDVTRPDEPEDSGMVVVYLALAIAFLLVLAGAAVLIASRSPQ